MHRRNVFDRFMSATGLSGESVPGVSLVEVYSDRRVLIENHQGISDYGCNKIRARVRSGEIWICGRNLQILHMNKTQIVISGKIQDICMKTGGKA